MINPSDVGGELIFDDNRITTGIGQRGQYSCMGVDVYCDGDIVKMTGITITKSIAGGFLSIPKDDIPQFIEILKKIYDN